MPETEVPIPFNSLLLFCSLCTLILAPGSFWENSELAAEKTVTITATQEKGKLATVAVVIVLLPFLVTMSLTLHQTISLS